MNTKITHSEWFPDNNLLITHISGDVTKEDISLWEQSLYTALERINDNGSFKILVNLYGFKAVDFEAHKAFRTIVPATLANYGWRTGYLDLFEEAANLQLTQTRGISCIAAAHVHQDETKIEKYEALFGKATEHFFTDPFKAEHWIRSI
jgi:hypothetical protein